MEYDFISRTEYKKCQDIAEDILTKAAQFADISNIQQLSLASIIDFLNQTLKPKIVGFYCPINPIPTQTELIKIFNKQFAKHNLPLRADSIVFVDQVFVSMVDGVSVNDSSRSAIFLNVSTNNFSRITFTYLHELIHLYQETTCSTSTLTNSKIETETNIIVSLLLFPDAALNLDIKTLKFSRLQKKYGASRSALFNRLRNYFYYTFEYDFFDALIFTREFAIDKKSKSYYHFLKLLYETDL